MKEKRPIRRGILFGAAAVLIAAVALAVGVWIGSWLHSSAQLVSAVSPEQDKLAEIRSYIEEYYLFETDSATLLAGQCEGMLNSLGDAYSQYFTPEELEYFQASSEGKIVGVGAVIQINPKTNEVCITDVLPDGPAAQAGIRAKDILLFVGDLSVEDISLDVISQSYVTGEPNTQVSLTVYRPATNETLDFIVTRASVVFSSVEYRMLENRTGYISIFEFSDHMPDEFIAAIEELENQGMEQVILDLRNNPGGNLQAAVKIADYLLPDFYMAQGENSRTTIVALKDKRGTIEQYECADGNSVELPIAVLVNEYSASASELLSGALRDYGRAGLVGVNTFGKGVSQSLLYLSDGSAIKLTSMQYFTPSGFALQGVGLKPDVLAEDILSADNQDNQLAAAIEALEEIRQGKQKLPIPVNEKKEPQAPKAFLEQAMLKPCKTKHLAVNIRETEELISKLSAGFAAGTLCRIDSWRLDEERGYERSITVDSSSDESIWAEILLDSVTEELHQVELYLPIQQAVKGTLDALEIIDPSLSEADRSKLTKALAAYPLEADRTLTEILKKKDYTVYAGYEEEILSVIIQQPS